MELTTYLVHVGPIEGDVVYQRYRGEEIARNAVRVGLAAAADASPRDSAEIDGVLTRLEAAEGSFLDYFTVAGERWRARYEPE